MPILGVLVLAAIVVSVDCAPEVGSKTWCTNMKDKPKGEWTANDATNFAKHCLFGGDE